MDPVARPDLALLLEQLAAAGVDFILVGGLAAVAQGAPVTTMDADIVQRRVPANIDKLFDVLTRLDAHVRDPGGRRLRPSKGAFMGPGHQLLVTRLGPLDCLGSIEKGLTYDDLVDDTATIELRGQSLRVLTLPKLLELKRQWSDDEARLRAAILEKTIGLC